ncbi:GPI mannosyltransferase, partial [Blyttiomyces helicus]
LFFLVCAFRAHNAVSIRTYYDPDEYWQSLEVAHEALSPHTCGYLTWEWAHRIRGFAHPLIFVGVYKVLQVLGLDDTELLVVAPRLVQSVFVAMADVYTFMLANKIFGPRASKWAIMCSLMSWYIYFAGVRTLSNSIESAFTVVGLYYWPWPRFGGFRLSLLAAATGCILRPTNGIIWVFLGAQLILYRPRLAVTVLIDVALIMIFAVQTSIGIDRLFYKTWTFVPLNFITHNLLTPLASFYGNHPPHWYITQALPLTLFTFLPLIIPVLLNEGRTRTLTPLCAWTTAAYSLLPHKEFRFLMPLVPVGMVLAGEGLRRVSRWRAGIIVGLALSNGAMGWYFSRVHQRGVVDVVGWLR